ncbi:biotin--[acetyl-CoA-carboxylase] synthetase [Candidatus Pantoea edessiphila]|uniref:Bifunctional ligase/repressor BirA n=1 Tax=Candidatus Pantoea edessiphila TaxID=2044610 RepID=A0A2P5T140_9GAMM|nr:bifunctional biotin--[acetyl-CoA-carboxylase] ligase/biotin operon repressor BirA [Candidatus Pantoea edessiphila]PPI88298.1 biotin--[acetyl-CoA-carboxylase] synthetase [Candidatus Pantoea edessiphila]
MNIKLKLIDILSNGKIYSGNRLSKNLGISISSLSSKINILKSWGLDTHITSENEYYLLNSIKLINEKEIKSKLGKDTVLFIPVLNSTNQYLLDHIDFLRSGDICVAEHQIVGRGRHGRCWYSPFGCNVYMSMCWKLKHKRNILSSIALVIGVLVAETIQSLGVKNIYTKWPNDLYINGSKFAGILIEINKIRYNYTKIIIGVGINISMLNNFKNNLKINSQWITLKEIGYDINRNDLIVNLTKNFRKFLPIFEKEGFSPFLLRWKNLDSFTNKYVKLIIGKRELHGISRGIDNRGALILENNGKIQSWLGGEISLRTV